MRFSLMLMAAFALLPVAHAAKPKAVAPAKPAAAPARSELELFVHTSRDKHGALARIVERYNAGNPPLRVVLADRPWAGGVLPDMLLLNADEEANFLAGKARYRPLHQVMREANATLDAVRAPAQMSQTPLDAKGQLNALPIGLATPVMYVNKAAFRKANLDPEEPPKTWWDLQQALGRLYDAGYACPYATSWPRWIHVENVAAWHNAPFAAGGRSPQLAINGLLEVKHLAMMSSWVKSRYLHVFGRGDEADAKFAAGECAVLTSDSSAYPELTAGGKVEVGVAPLPYHDDIAGAPQNTLADGANLWLAAGRKPAEYAAMAAFVKYLLAPDTQIEIQRTVGALPLSRAGVMAAASGLLGPELPHIRVAAGQLNFKPVTAVSGRARLAANAEVRRIVDEELEALWADRKPAKAALDAAVARARAVKCPSAPSALC